MAHPRRRKPPGATTRGGWGHNHQQRRKAIAPLVRTGKATCARCGETVDPDEEWHLDHNADRTGYIGVSHSTCNLRAAAAVTNGHRTTAPHDELPYRWSQRWHEDPPIGTIVLGNEQVIYLGNGEWQPLGDSPG